MATPLTGTPIPLYTAVPDVPADLTAGFNNLEKYVLTRWASAAARDAAITAPIEGMIAWTNDTNILWQYDGTNWVQTPSWNSGPRGVQFIGKVSGGTSTYAGSTELVTHRFTGVNLDSTRHYRATLSMELIDGDATAGTTYIANGGANTRVRYAAGTNAGIASTQVLLMITALFGDDSTRAGGNSFSGTFTPATTTAYSFAITQQARNASILCRNLGSATLVIEDIGPAITEVTVAPLF